MEHGGLVIYYMKLEKGNFALPPLDEKGKTHPFSWQKLMLMVQGIDAEKCHYKKRWKSA
jgi:hypothetical protein